MNLAHNLCAGFRLACFRRVGAGDFRYGHEQLALLFAVQLLAAIACGYVLTEPLIVPSPKTR